MQVDCFWFFVCLFVMHTAYGISLRGLIFIAICFEIQSLIDVRELRRTIQSDWQHRVHNAKTNKAKTQHNMCCTSLYASKHNNVKHEPSYKRLEIKTNPMSFLCWNHNGHHNTELRTQKHILGQHKKTLKRWAPPTQLKKTRVNLDGRKV